MAHFLVIDESVHPSGVEILRRAGTVEVIPHTTDEDKIIQKLPSVDGILVRRGKMTGRIIDAAPRLKVIARHGVGVDSVDIGAVERRGIVLTITGDANTVAVAEFTMAMLLALARKICPASQDLRSGGWSPGNYLGAELQGRQIGVVGFGQIGKLVCKRAEAFGMRVLVADPFVDEETVAAAGGVKLEYDELVRRSDTLTYHVRLNEQTLGMFGREHLKVVKRGVQIINTARGGVCDENAVLEGLQSGVIDAIAFDAFAQEPLPGDHPLRSHPRAILTPHIAGQTGEAMVAMSIAAAQSIVDCIEGRPPKFVYRTGAA
jgi:D-3-phosphoglycerate dehydrogenase / 2-oxoglutarate reductase